MKKFFAEFREFALKGNMIDLAVGVIIGAAFNAVIGSIVKDLMMPVIGILLGGLDFSSLAVTVGTASIRYGALIQSAVNFLITATVLFLFVKAVNGFKRRRAAAKEAPATVEPAPVPEDIKLLTEIRDSLAELQKRQG